MSVWKKFGKTSKALKVFIRSVTWDVCAALTVTS